MHDGFCSPAGRNGSGGGGEEAGNGVSTSAAAAQSGEIEINETNFPDAAFREFLKTGKSGESRNGDLIDKNQDGKLSQEEIAAVKAINCYGLFGLDPAANPADPIEKLTGIECFTALEYLKCNNNQLTELDVSNNTELKWLECNNNQLAELNVSNNTALTRLDCSFNSLTKLNVSNDAALEDLNCGTNQLAELNVSNNTALKSLNCNDNQLTELVVGNNTALTSLDCGGNELTELDVSKNTELTRLNCHWSYLKELNVSKNTKLEYLSCGHNQMTKLDVSNNTELKELQCVLSQLTELDVSKNTELKVLDCNNNQLTKLDVSKNTELELLDCSDNQLTSLDIGNTNCGLGGKDLLCYNNSYYIEVDPENRFELKNLPGNFNVKNASNWIGGSVSVDGTTLTVDEGVDKVTYTYNCGSNKAGTPFSATFTLDLTGDNVNPDIPADGGHTGGGSGSMIGGIIIGGVLAWGAYEAGTGIYRAINMPGIAMPSNRGELAMLLWEHAGKPEPVSTALYSDITEDDIDLNKAARWAVEQGLMQDNSEKNTFNPRFPVSKLRTCLTWNAAKEKGLFDTDKTAE